MSLSSRPSFFSCSWMTVLVGVHLALAVVRAAAGTVQESLGAARDRADGAVFVKDTLAAEGALLLVVTGPLDVAQEERVGAGDHVLVRAFAHRLGAGAAGEDEEGLGLFGRFLVLSTPTTFLPAASRAAFISATSFSPPVWVTVAHSPQPTMNTVLSPARDSRISSMGFFLAMIT